MATKINTDYYGAENTFVEVKSSPYVKRSASTVGALKTDGIYTGGSFDFSASPWGVGESSISSDFSQTISKSDTFDFHECINKRKNTPFWLYYNTSTIGGGDDISGLAGSSVSSTNWSRLIYKNRIDPDTEIVNNRAESSLAIDNGNVVDVPDSVLQYPVTMLDYQHVRLVIGNIWVKPVDSNDIKRVSFSDIVNNTVNVDKIIRITTETHDNTHKLDLMPSIGGSELDIPEIYKTCYYGDKDKYVRPWRYINSVGYWYYDINYLSTYFVYNLSDSLQYTSSYETPTNDDIISALPVFNYWGHLSPKQQVFDDVSYHWEYGISTYAENQFNINPIRNGDAYQSGVYRAYCYMDIDDIGTHETKNAAFAAAILHEFAFMGLPIVTTTSDRSKAIGDNDVYLPVFNEHMVTTGDYVNGSASLDLPNATWGDIFGTDMPDYDPDYDPDAPPSPNDDYGYLDNKPITNRVYSSNNRVYALTAAQYSQFINDVNSLYLDNPDTGYASFQLDFKGTNPSDYIVGTYGYTFLPAGIIPNQQPEAIQIGAVTLPNAKGYKIAPSYIYNFKSLGEIDLTGAGDYKPFGDFRDFEPYTHIELYIPLCGNIELDPAAVVGHTIQIDIIFDIMTGNATACVYRDNKTLIATVAGQLAASLPLSSGRMGDYQNAVKSAENALKQNELKATTAAASVAIGVGAALLAPETGGLSLAAYGAAMTGGASLMSLSNQKNQIEYEIKHKQPSISVCSSANGAVAQNISSMYAVCYVKQCKLLSSYNAATYAHTVGHACVINTTIGAETTDDSNSLIVCSNADLSGIPATAAEINAIQSLLTGGVYV